MCNNEAVQSIDHQIPSNLNVTAPFRRLSCDQFVKVERPSYNWRRFNLQLKVDKMTREFFTRFCSNTSFYYSDAKSKKNVVSCDHVVKTEQIHHSPKKTIKISPLRKRLCWYKSLQTAVISNSVSTIEYKGNISSHNIQVACDHVVESTALKETNDDKRFWIVRPMRLTPSREATPARSVHAESFVSLCSNNIANSGGRPLSEATMSSDQLVKTIDYTPTSSKIGSAKCRQKLTNQLVVELGRDYPSVTHDPNQPSFEVSNSSSGEMQEKNLDLPAAVVTNGKEDDTVVANDAELYLQNNVISLLDKLSDDINSLLLKGDQCVCLHDDSVTMPLANSNTPHNQIANKTDFLSSQIIHDINNSAIETTSCNAMIDSSTLAIGHSKNEGLGRVQSSPLVKTALQQQTSSAINSKEIPEKTISSPSLERRIVNSAKGKRSFLVEKKDVIFTSSVVESIIINTPTVTALPAQKEEALVSIKPIDDVKLNAVEHDGELVDLDLATDVKCFVDLRMPDCIFVAETEGQISPESSVEAPSATEENFMNGLSLGNTTDEIVNINNEINNSDKNSGSKQKREFVFEQMAVRTRSFVESVVVNKPKSSVNADSQTDTISAIIDKPVMYTNTNDEILESSNSNIDVFNVSKTDVPDPISIDGDIQITTENMSNLSSDCSAIETLSVSNEIKESEKLCQNGKQKRGFVFEQTAVRTRSFVESVVINKNNPSTSTDCQIPSNIDHQIPSNIDSSSQLNGVTKPLLVDANETNANINCSFGMKDIDVPDISNHINSTGLEIQEPSAVVDNSNLLAANCSTKGRNDCKAELPESSYSGKRKREFAFEKMDIKTKSVVECIIINRSSDEQLHHVAEQNQCTAVVLTDKSTSALNSENNISNSESITNQNHELIEFEVDSNFADDMKKLVTNNMDLNSFDNTGALVKRDVDNNHTYDFDIQDHSELNSNSSSINTVAENLDKVDNKSDQLCAFDKIQNSNEGKPKQQVQSNSGKQKREFAVEKTDVKTRSVVVESIVIQRVSNAQAPIEASKEVASTKEINLLSPHKEDLLHLNNIQATFNANSVAPSNDILLAGNDSSDFDKSSVNDISLAGNEASSVYDKSSVDDVPTFFKTQDSYNQSVDYGSEVEKLCNVYLYHETIWILEEKIIESEKNNGDLCFASAGVDNLPVSDCFIDMSSVKTDLDPVSSPKHSTTEIPNVCDKISFIPTTDEMCHHSTLDESNMPSSQNEYKNNMPSAQNEFNDNYSTSPLYLEIVWNIEEKVIEAEINKSSFCAVQEQNQERNSILDSNNVPVMSLNNTKVDIPVMGDNETNIRDIPMIGHKETNTRDIPVIGHNETDTQNVPLTNYNEDNTQSVSLTDDKEDNTQNVPMSNKEEDNTQNVPMAHDQEDNSLNVQEDNSLNVPQTNDNKDNSLNVPQTDDFEENTQAVPLTDEMEDNTQNVPQTDNNEDNRQNVPFTYGNKDNGQNLLLTDNNCEPLSVFSPSCERVIETFKSEQPSENEPIKLRKPVSHKNNVLFDFTPAIKVMGDNEEPTTDDKEENRFNVPLTDNAKIIHKMYHHKVMKVKIIHKTYR